MPTRDTLILDKIASGDWAALLGTEKPLFVNAVTWNLVIPCTLTGSVDETGIGAALSRLVTRLGEPVIRKQRQSPCR